MRLILLRNERLSLEHDTLYEFCLIYLLILYVDILYWNFTKYLNYQMEI